MNVNVEFLKDRPPYRKDEIINVPERLGARLKATGKPGSVSVHPESDDSVKPNFDGEKLRERQARQKKAEIDKLKKKADELEAARK